MNKILINSTSKKSLHLYLKFLNIIFNKLNLTFSIFNFPSTKTRIALLKSPHVYKKAKEHFEKKKFQVVFFFHSPVEIHIFKYILLNKPKSVCIKFKF